MKRTYKKGEENALHCLTNNCYHCGGINVGNELYVSAFVHPQLRALEDKVHIAGVQSLARTLGAVMPFWYAAVFILTTVVAFRLYSAQAASARLAIVSATLWLFSIIYTIVGPVPINNQVSRWNLESLPDNWKQLRSKWDTLHAIRVVILVIAFACLVVACLEENWVAA